jgi:hypothetical protein
MRTTFWLENLKGRYHLGDLSLDRRVILEWNFDKYGGKV